MDSRDGSDEVLEKPSVEIASYYLAEEKPSREPCRCGTIGKITEILWAVVARSINEQMYKLPTSLQSKCLRVPTVGTKQNQT